MRGAPVSDVVSGAARWALIEGDALDVIRSLPDASVDALITDPPYSSGGMFRGDRVGMNTTEKYVQTGQMVGRADFAGDNRDQRSFAYWCALWLGELIRVCKPGAPGLLFSDWRQLPSVTDALQAGGWIWRGIVAWDKTEATRPQMGRFRSQCEYVVWGSNGPMEPRESVGVLPGYFRQGVMQDDKFHITGKPTALMCDLVKICEPGGVILDPFAGSGTTGVAALLRGYRFIGIERTAEYSDVAQRRLQAAVADTNWREPKQMWLLERVPA